MILKSVLNSYKTHLLPLIENLSNYIIWPYGKTNLKYIANYSVAIVAMYILFKNKKYDIELDNNIKIILKILLARKYDTTYAIDFMKEHFPNELKWNNVLISMEFLI